MKILVLGAGVVGTAAAYYLARDGHDVTVVERHAGGGDGHQLLQCRPGLARRRHRLGLARGAEDLHQRRSTRHDLGIKVRLRLDPYFYAWSLRFLFQCTNATAARQHRGQAQAGALFARLHQRDLGRNRHRL